MCNKLILTFYSQKITVQLFNDRTDKFMTEDKILLKPDRNSAVKFLNDYILYGKNKGNTDFEIIFKDDGAFSNACAPIAGIINYYKKIGYNFKINFSRESYISKTYIDSPLSVNENICNDRIKNPFDKVWFFKSDTEINNLINSYILSIRQSDIIGDGVLRSIEWCLCEVMDNIIQHSNAECGYIMGQIHHSTKRLSFCIFDAGIGIYNSLKSSKHNPTTPLDAITIALQENITRDSNIGQGNGLWGLLNIIKLSQGSLRISSNGATYMNDCGKIRIVKSGHFNLGRHFGTTTVDFQFNYSQDINISKALSSGEYQPVDLWLEDLENDNDDNIITINVLKMSNGTGTRKSAEKLRNLTLNIVKNDKKIVMLDFSDVNIVSSSFADELIGKIIKEIGFLAFNQAYRIINVKPSIAAIINRSVEQRMAQNFFNN